MKTAFVLSKLYKGTPYYYVEIHPDLDSEESYWIEIKYFKTQEKAVGIAKEYADVVNIKHVHSIEYEEVKGSELDEPHQPKWLC